MKPDSTEPRPSPPPPSEPGQLPNAAAAEQPAAAAGTSAEQTVKRPKLRGFWFEVWRRYRRNFFGVAALTYVAVLSAIAVLSPIIAGTKPIIVRYRGQISMPALGYFYEPWEDRTNVAQELRKRYTPEKLKEKDPNSWAVWPLVFQDPFRRVRKDEWPGQPGNLSGSDGKPSRHNLLGTNQRGVDVFAVLIHGTRVALLVGFVSTGIAALIGMTLGAMAGYYGGWADILLSRMMEVMMCIPTLVLILALLAIVDRPTIWHTMIVLGVTGWTSIARLMRAEFLKLRTSEYVTAARALGAGQFRVMFRHILPNALAPVLVPISFGIASAVLIENALSFLGFGSPPPSASWGSLLSAGQRNLEMWWLIVFPGAAIFFTVLAYNLIGEALQESTDPRLGEGTK